MQRARKQMSEDNPYKLHMLQYDEERKEAEGRRAERNLGLFVRREILAFVFVVLAIVTSVWFTQKVLVPLYYDICRVFHVGH